MKIYRSQLYFLWLIGLFVSSCNGQVNTNVSEANANKQGTEIIGTPPQDLPGMVTEPGLVSQYIRCIFQDSKGNYWFGPAGQSVARYDGKTLQYFDSSVFFQGNDSVDREFGNSVHAITEDQHGNIWFGTDYGVIKYDGHNFKSYTKQSGLTNIRISRKSILTDQSGNLWVGTKGGVFRYVPTGDFMGGKSFVPFDSLPPIDVKDIMEDRNGDLWFASAEKGVFRYDGKTIENIAEKKNLGNNYAGGIAQDQEGNMWFTMEGGICKYDGQTFTEFTTKDGLGGREIWGLLIEDSNTIWVSARGSTTKFDLSIPLSDPNAFKVFTPADGINCCVQSMYQDRSGKVWWGAGSGLYRFDGTNFYQVKQDGPW